MSRMRELGDALRAYDCWAVLGHVNPDGDAAGSCIALALALRALGKRAFVYLPGGLPSDYAGFARTMEIVSEGMETPFVPESALSVDVSEAERLGSGRAIFESCAHRAMLDHHGTNAGFGDVYLVDGAAAACGELAVELIAELDIEMNPEMAQWLYIAICTDCGRFGFSSTRAETMEAAAQCLRAGVDVDAIHRELYRTRSEGRTRLLGLALSGLEMNAAKTMCWTRVTEDMFRAAGALREDSEGIVNYLLEIRGVRFACLAEERGGAVKFSLRSKSPLNVAQEVAVPLGGGGHMCAAGVTLNLPMEEALRAVLNRARAALLKDEEQR